MNKEINLAMSVMSDPIEAIPNKMKVKKERNVSISESAKLLQYMMYRQANDSQRSKRNKLK